MPSTLPSRTRLLRTIVVTASIITPFAACGRFEPPDTASRIPIEYPVAHYRVTDRAGDFIAWKNEVRALRASLRDSYPFEEQRPSLEGASKEAAFLDQSDPALIVWRDPASFWRAPINLSWWELIDETGAIRKVVVVSSNQSPDEDSRIIAWCLDGKRWQPAVVDGRPTASIRTASINLGESKWHIAYWQKKVSEEAAAVIAVFLIAIGVRAAWSVAGRRRKEREPDSKA